MKRICVLLLAMALLLTVLVMPTVAEAPAVRLECESTPFTAVDSEGRTCETSNQYSTWAWSLNLNKEGIKGTISNNLAYFRSGGVNGYLDFSLENDALTAGTYEMYLNVRPNGESYCTVDFSVNGGSLLTYTFQKDVESAGGMNQENVMRLLDLGKVTLRGDGSDIFRITMTQLGRDLSKSGLAIDYMELVPAEEAEPDVLTQTISACPAIPDAQNPAQFDLTWNLALSNGLDDPEQNFEAFNSQYDILDFGVVVAATEADIRDHGQALVKGEESPEDLARKVYQTSYGSTVYSHASYRRTNVQSNRQRYLLVYVVYQAKGTDQPLYAFSNYSGCIAQ